MKKLFIDFDAYYYQKNVPDDRVVLTNVYDQSTVVNTRKETFNRDYFYEDFELYCQSIEDQLNIDLRPHKILLFESFFLPMSIWFHTIDDLFVNNKINQESEVIFSSFSDNNNIFVFEAEGESNGQFLYKKSYFLSFYIREYLKSKGIKKFTVLKSTTFQSKVSYFLRGPLILFIKYFQLLFYRLSVNKRVYGDFHDSDKGETIVFFNRGIIQSQFVTNFIGLLKTNTVMIVNEASTYPFRNLKYLKSTGFKKFLYAEGNISVRKATSMMIKSLSSYCFNQQKCLAEFKGIKVDYFSFIPEINIKEFHYKTYTESVIKTLQIIKRTNVHIKKIYTFEMLAPFAHYLNINLNEKVYQLQTTSIFNKKYPDFVYGEKFYFINEASYQEQKLVNTHMANKFDVLNNLKYLGASKIAIKHQVLKVTYFTQPIYLAEEKNIVTKVQQFCESIGAALFIKLHPRSKADDFTDYQILNAAVSSTDAIIDTDLVITRNSSIGEDCWFLNVPVIFAVHGTLHGKGMSYMPSDYSGVLKNENDFLTLKHHYLKIMDDFYTHPLHKKYFVNQDDLIQKLS